MRVRIKTKKNLFQKGDVQTFSRDIYQIIEKKGQKNTLKNLNTGQDIKRTYQDDELDQTFDKPEQPKKKVVRKEAKPKLDLKKTIAVQRQKRTIKKPERLDL